MFFILSKILVFIITPLVWIIGLLAYSFFTKNPNHKKITVVTAFSLLLFFSNSFILDEFMRKWEIPATKYEKLAPTYDYGILLGGMISYDHKFERVNFTHSVDRLMQTIDLYKRGIIKKIFIAGGSGSITNPHFKEGRVIHDYLIRMGIPEEDVLCETKSKNTRENALFTAEKLDSEKDAKFLLITSAFHMKRSLGCFKKAGIDADPFSTDRHSGPRKYIFDHLFIPNIEALYIWNTLIHEVVGYITYSSMGYV